MKRRILQISILGLLFIFFSNLNSIIYGVRQGLGQYHILSNAEPIETFLNDPNFPDSLKTKLHLIDEVRKFAIVSLGVNDSKNYTTLFDQKGKPVLWAMSASEVFKIEAYEWCFPFAGCFPYKGYFKEELIREEQLKMESKGFDTYVRSVDGWSTLGYFEDPILSNMLLESEGELAELIIHELTHSTIFVKDSSDYNENLATIIGIEGAKEFLRFKYGLNSTEYQNYLSRIKDNKVFEKIIKNGIEELRVFYDSIRGIDNVQLQLNLKQQRIKRIFCRIDTGLFQNKERFAWLELNDFFPNNAYFSLYLTYHEGIFDFETEFQFKFHSDVKEYLNYLKQEYGIN